MANPKQQNIYYYCCNSRAVRMDTFTPTRSQRLRPGETDSRRVVAEGAGWGWNGCAEGPCSFKLRLVAATVQTGLASPYMEEFLSRKRPVLLLTAEIDEFLAMNLEVRKRLLAATNTMISTRRKCLSLSPVICGEIQGRVSALHCRLLPARSLCRLMLEKGTSSWIWGTAQKRPRKKAHPNSSESSKTHWLATSRYKREDGECSIVNSLSLSKT